MKQMKQMMCGLLLLCLLVTSMVVAPQNVKAAAKTDWKKVYTKIIKEKYNPSHWDEYENYCFKLIYINNDSIPELVAFSEYWKVIYTLKGSEYSEISGGYGETFTYDKKSNMILMHHGRHVVVTDDVYKIKNGKFVSIWSGDYVSDDGVHCRDYSINGKDVSASTYKKKIKPYKKKCNLDVEKAKSYSYNEILKKLESSGSSKKNDLKSKYYDFVRQEYINGWLEQDLDCWMYDFNKDGVKELVILLPGGVKGVFDVYTYVNGKIKSIGYGNEVGYIKGQKYMVHFFHGGATNYEYDVYKLESGKAKLVYSYFCRDEVFYKNTKPSSDKNIVKITEKEFKAFEKTVGWELGKGFKVTK